MYQLNQFGTPNCIRSASSSLSNVLFPTKRIAEIELARPSSTLIVMRTRLRSSGVTVVFTETP